MINNLPLISIIVPAWNAEKYIHDCIESVIKQTYRNWELIIVNDGSTDSTETMIAAFNDPRIKYFRQERLGVSAARNKGLEMATGDFICTLDADDQLTPTSLMVRIEILDEIPHADFIDGPVEWFFDNSDRPRGTWKPSYKGNPLKELLKLNGSCFYGATWMVRKSKIGTIRYKNGMTHAEDLLFYIDISTTGMYCYCDQTILLYRKHPQSAMTNLDALKKGYYDLLIEIKKKKSLSFLQLTRLRSKLASIMFKTYLKAKKPIKALLSVTTFMFR